MESIKVPKDVYEQDISWFSDETIIACLEKKGIKTVKEVVSRQDEIPKKIMGKIMVEIGYAAFNVRPSKN